MIPEAHGGRLIDLQASPEERARREAERRDLLLLRPFEDQIFDAEKIGIGAYSPLEGFMGREAFESVLSTGRLPSGIAWSMPIPLAPAGDENAKTVGVVSPGDEVGLLDSADRLFAILRVEEKFPLDKRAFALGTYGTADAAHPNVADIQALGPTALGGPISLLRRLDLPTGAFELSPSGAREEFRRRGWKSVAAYQCRNPPHTAHEYLQRLTLDREDVDALFIHPVVGRLKLGDYKPEIILRAYRALVENYHPPSRVLLAAFSIAMRYAGPKAALFLGIVRKNFGCSHYIV
ncbi:MAG: sulfate adenylyltransferase, partial [Thermoplasmata archaeon]|nr:sulfate adenylyltransferase [Thermoplasmata archaeon]